MILESQATKAPPKKLKTEYNHLYFVKTIEGPKHPTWDCYRVEDGNSVGRLEWFESIDQYCFMENRMFGVLSLAYLKELCAFIGLLAREKESQNKGEKQ